MCGRDGGVCVLTAYGELDSRGRECGEEEPRVSSRPGALLEEVDGGLDGGTGRVRGAGATAGMAGSGDRDTQPPSERRRRRTEELAQ